MRRFTAAAPEGRIPPTDYGQLLGEMTGKDPDDHPIGAAARRGADVLLTHNLADFPPADLGTTCTPMTPAVLFADLAESYPEDLATVIRRSAAALSRPPLTAHEVLDKLEEVGLGEMATRLRPFLS